jgi:hypothetical protein
MMGLMDSVYWGIYFITGFISFLFFGRHFWRWRSEEEKSKKGKEETKEEEGQWVEKNGNFLEIS